MRFSLAAPRVPFQGVGAGASDHDRTKGFRRLGHAVHGCGDLGIPPWDPGGFGNPGDRRLHRRIQVRAHGKALLLVFAGVEDRRPIGRAIGPRRHDPLALW